MKLLILVSLTVIFVASIAILLAITIDIDENNAQNISQTKITDVIPNAVLSGGDASWRTTNVVDVKDDIDYTIEGTVLEFGQPIEFTGIDNRGTAAIPVTMSVDTVHKGNWSESTFTFYLTAMVILNPSQITKNMSFNDVTDNHLTMYAGQDYSDVEKTYSIINHHDLFEINDKLIVHIYTEYLEDINYIYEKDQGSLDPRYILVLGPYAYYEIIDNLGFNEKYSNGISVSSIRLESLP